MTRFAALIVALVIAGYAVNQDKAIEAAAVGQHRVLVINLKRFASEPDPWTPAQSGAVVFGAMAQGYAAGSYGQMQITGQSVGWYAFDYGFFCQNHLLAAVIGDTLAQQAGVNLADYPHRIYYNASPDPSCTWGGLSTLGGTPSRLWVNGNLNPALVGHEFGHSLGLNHAHARRCTGGVLTSPCTNQEYGAFDPMGDARGIVSLIGQFNAHQKYLLGWLGGDVSPPLTTVLRTGTYRIAPLETPADGQAKGLKIFKSLDTPQTGARTSYYVQQRVGVPGVLISLGGESVSYDAPAADNDFLLDMTPETGWSDASLLAGQTYTDPDVCRIHVLESDAAGTTLQVTLLSGNRALP